MTRTDAIDAPSLEWLDRTRTQLLVAAPFYLLVPVVLYGLTRLAGHVPSAALMGAGALGWFVALLLRGPLAPVAQKIAKTPQQAGTFIGAASGPLEEGVRALFLIWLGRDLSSALAIGIGWAGIESIFAVINALVANVLLRRDDPKAAEARELLAQNGSPDSGPWWGVLERLSASALHIGNTLILAWLPMAALVTAPLHSLINLVVVRLSKRSVVQAEGLLALAGILTLGLGLILLHAI